jgi:glycosyltransferase involved in cell wall biosynthesis
MEDRFTRLENCLYENKINTINTGVDITEFDPTTYKKDKNNNSVVITQVANIAERKNQKLLIQSLTELDDSVGNYMMNFAGEIPSGEDEYYQELEQLVVDFNLQNRVTFLGWVDDIPELLANTDVFVLPSYNEGLPRSLLEAAAMATPMITTPAGGSEEIVIDGLTGYVVSPDDSLQLANRLYTLIESSELREVMGDNARRYIKSRFTLERYIADFEEFVTSRYSSQTKRSS